MSLEEIAPEATPADTLSARIAADLGQALAEALSDRLDAVAEAVGEGDPTEMVHDVRKALKDYRALLRLIPTAEAKAARTAASQIARTLSAARDLKAAQDALEALRDARLIGRAEATAAAGLLAAEIPPDAALPERDTVSAFLETARAALADGLAAAAREADVLAGIAKGYRRARKSPDWSLPVAIHELRKRVVIHRYQMSFIAAFAGTGAGRARKAQRLRDVLGLHQDIEALKPRLASALGTEHEALISDVAGAAREMQRRLIKEAKARHAALFQRPGRAFAARLSERIAAPR